MFRHRLGLRPTVARPFVLSGVRTVLTRAPGFLFGAEAVVRKFCTPLLTVLCWWTPARLTLLKFRPDIGRILIAQSFYAPSQTAEKRPWALSCMSVCPSVRRMKQSGCHWRNFHEILYLNIFRKSVENIQPLTIIMGTLRPELLFTFMMLTGCWQDRDIANSQST
jgi:hypothetical protein